MMPVVRLNDATFADLKSISMWLGTKTPSDTIDEVVRKAMRELDMERDDEPESLAAESSGKRMQFDSAPGLAFTKPTSATVNGTKIQNPRWSGILLAMILQLKVKGIASEKLVRELQIPAKVKVYSEEGFKYHPELGISIQGQSASDAWKETDRLAKKWRIPVTVEFQWRDNPKAQFRCRKGILRTGNI